MRPRFRAYPAPLGRVRVVDDAISCFAPHQQQNAEPSGISFLHFLQFILRLAALYSDYIPVNISHIVSIFAAFFVSVIIAFKVTVCLPITIANIISF